MVFFSSYLDFNKQLLLRILHNLENLTSTFIPIYGQKCANCGNGLKMILGYCYCFKYQFWTIKKNYFDLDPGPERNSILDPDPDLKCNPDSQHDHEPDI